MDKYAILLTSGSWVRKPGDKNNLISTKNEINKAMRTRKGWKLMVAKTRRPLAHIKSRGEQASLPVCHCPTLREPKRV